MIVVCTQRIKPVPSEEDGVILPCAIVVGVQAVCEVELLTVVLVLLQGHTCRGMVAVWRAERIIVGILLHRDIRHGGVMDGAQLLACGGVDVFRDIAVGELHTAGIVPLVVLYQRYASASVALQRASIHDFSIHLARNYIESTNTTLERSGFLLSTHTLSIMGAFIRLYALGIPNSFISGKNISKSSLSK